MTMTAKYTATIVAVTSSKGEFKDDDGKTIEYDSTKVYVQLELSGEKSRGTVTQVYKIGPSSAYDIQRLGTIELPFQAELEIQKVSNGREQREKVVGFQVLTRTRPSDQLTPGQAAAKAA